MDGITIISNEYITEQGFWSDPCGTSDLTKYEKRKGSRNMNIRLFIG